MSKTKIFIFSLLVQTSTTFAICVSGVCRDQTISLNYKEKHSYYEGKCAQIALSNVINMTCSKSAPSEYFTPEDVDDLSYDYTPGTRASTLLAMANKALSNKTTCPDNKKRSTKKEIKLNMVNGTSAYDFINKLTNYVTGSGKGIKFQRIIKTQVYKDDIDHRDKIQFDAEEWRTYAFKEVEIKKNVISPVIVCTQSGGEGHYVTVVNIESFIPNSKKEIQDKCMVTYNDQGKQNTRDCTEFAKDAALEKSLYESRNVYFTRQSCGKYAMFYLTAN